MSVKYKVLCAAMAIASVIAASASAAVQLTPQEEQVAGQGHIRITGAAYLPESPALSKIQANIVKANSGRLRMYTSDSSRGLHSVHLLLTDNKKVNAYSIAGGHIFISDAMTVAFMAKSFNPDTGSPSGMQKKLGNGYEFYGHSALAAAMAHEFCHWERNFLQGEINVLMPHIDAAGEKAVYGLLQRGDGAGFMRELDSIAKARALKPVQQYVYKEELAADKGAMEYLSNSDIYSPGSILTLVTRLKETKIEKSLTPHPDTAARAKQAAEYIAKESGGRITLDADGRMRLDGKLFMGNGYMPERNDVTAYDRTVFVAGQLAKCVRRNAKSVIPMATEKEYSLSGSMVPLLAVNEADTRYRFVIDKFAVPFADAYSITDGKSAEHKAAKEIVRFLQN